MPPNESRVNATDFINLGAFAKAIAQELKETLELVSPIETSFQHGGSLGVCRNAGS